MHPPADGCRSRMAGMRGATLLCPQSAVQPQLSDFVRTDSICETTGSKGRSMSTVLLLPRLRSFRILLVAPALAVGIAVLFSSPARSDASPLPMGWSPGLPLPGSYGHRWDAASAYFPPLDEVVMFGGAPADAGQPWKNDTWVYSVQTGTWAGGPTAPEGLTVRGGAAMA